MLLEQAAHLVGRSKQRIMKDFSQFLPRFGKSRISREIRELARIGFHVVEFRRSITVFHVGPAIGTGKSAIPAIDREGDFADDCLGIRQNRPEA